jgi:hypothetical protein
LPTPLSRVLSGNREQVALGDEPRVEHLRMRRTRAAMNPIQRSQRVPSPDL